jgi:hypothetical protein
MEEPHQSAILGRFTMNAADFNELSEAEKNLSTNASDVEKWLIGVNSTMCCFTKPTTSRNRTFNTARIGQNRRMKRARFGLPNGK